MFERILCVMRKTVTPLLTVSVLLPTATSACTAVCICTRLAYCRQRLCIAIRLRVLPLMTDCSVVLTRIMLLWDSVLSECGSRVVQVDFR